MLLQKLERQKHPLRKISFSYYYKICNHLDTFFHHIEFIFLSFPFQPQTNKHLRNILDLLEEKINLIFLYTLEINNCLKCYFLYSFDFIVYDKKLFKFKVLFSLIIIIIIIFIILLLLQLQLFIFELTTSKVLLYCYNINFFFFDI